jgi:hypothetical protein
VLQTAAMPVANGLLHAYQLGDTPFPAVDQVTFDALRTAIPLHPVYQGGTAATGGSYVHNG